MILKVTKEIMDYLIDKDPIFQKFYDCYGYIEYESNMSFFESIVFHIIGQMLSNKVSFIIFNRLISTLGEISAKRIKEADAIVLRECGISYSKIKYIKEFAQNYDSGMFAIDKMQGMEDLEIRTYLKRINGVGDWTAEMISLFTLGRENIFSYSDVALKLGILEAHKEFKTLSKKRFERLKKLYSPYGSYASLYYYRYHDSNIKNN